MSAGYSLETLSPLQICSQSTQPAFPGSSPRNAFWVLSLSGVWVVGSSPSLHTSCDSPNLTSACPHLRDHDMSESMLPTGPPNCRSCLPPPECPWYVHQPVVPASSPAPLYWGPPKILSPHWTVLKWDRMGNRSPPFQKCLLLTSHLCEGLFRAQPGQGFNLLLRLQKVQLQLRDAQVPSLPRAILQGSQFLLPPILRPYKIGGAIQVALASVLGAQWGTFMPYVSKG